MSATRFPTHTLPQNGNFDEKDEKNDDKTKYCCPDHRASRPSGSVPPLPETPLALRRMIRQILFSIPTCPNRADDHSALSRARGPTSPTRRSLAIWRRHFRHGPEGGGDQLPICSERSIVASVSAGQQVRRKTYYN